MRLGVFSPSVVLGVAKRSGALPDEVDEVPATSSVEQLTDLFDGRLDAVLTNPDNVLAYRSAEASPLRRAYDVRIVAAIDRGLGLSLFRAPGIDDPRGGVLGVDVPTSGFAYVAYELAAREGLRAVADYEVRMAGTTPRRALALAAGQCTMTVLGAGNDIRAEAAGCQRLSRATSLGPYLGTVLATRGDTLDGSPDALMRFATGVLATSAALAASRLRDVAVEVAADRLGLSPEGSGAYVDTLADPWEGLVPDGQVDQDSLRTLGWLRERYGPAGWDRERALADPGLVDPRVLSTVPDGR